MKPQAPVDLAIGSLTLEGFGPGARGACAEAFAAEFELLICRRGFPTPRSDAAHWRLPPLAIAVATGDSHRRIGRALARSLFEALHQAAEAP
ncbi:hypothetical protein [uncultured Rhodoblastus sp.]|uniref:hypothetical protein n=1 Tax=uncultured Rhodoblastus sp. TaxID=543037 RepID=UPI0025F83495|nr:hypothetical protein [uncultured Rhodoblastus sp.]